jgi:hypothetical protein
LEHFVNLGIKVFKRKDYMNIFEDLSSTTASRDLKKGVELNLFEIGLRIKQIPTKTVLAIIP